MTKRVIRISETKATGDFALMLEQAVSLRKFSWNKIRPPSPLYPTETTVRLVQVSSVRPRAWANLFGKMDLNVPREIEEDRNSRHRLNFNHLFEYTEYKNGKCEAPDAPKITAEGKRLQRKRLLSN